MSPEGQPGRASAPSGKQAGTPPRLRTTRKRLARGPITIGEPAPTIEPRLAAVDPYRPDSIADGGSVFDLAVRAASVRGLYKRYTAGPRQDDVCLRVHEPTRTLIAAVADGVSGAPRSDLAAALAVRHASAAIARQLDEGIDEPDLGEAVEQAAWALVEEHRRHAGVSDAGVEETATSLATTLLVATINNPDSEAAAPVRLASVGDSPALLLEKNQFTTVAGPAGPEGLMEDSVAALPRAVHSISQESCSLDSGAVLLLCTDGLATPLAGGTGEVGGTLARELAQPPDIVDFARLLDFSRSTYDDDRTLVAVWVAQ